MVEVNVLGITKYTGSEVPHEELALLDGIVNDLYGTPDSIVHQLLVANLKYIHDLLAVVKNALDNPNFAGIAPQPTELGISLIAPWHVGREGWEVSFTAGEWTDYIGTFDAPFTMDEKAGLIIFGLVSMSADPKLDLVQYKIGNTTLPPQVVTPIQLHDSVNRIAVFPVPKFMLAPKAQGAMRLMSLTGGDDYIVPVGVVIGTGEYLSRVPTAGAVA